ncbi:DUF4390 domain-containing protein [Methylotuvimicrobium sp. KM2]|uniref:DUF4390 domain-containing protein n=1 Tax=Methylotuvimicrobium sp. KM2 TaxID=3133976 RepID=UPI003101A7E2
MRVFESTNRLLSIGLWIALLASLLARPAFLHADESKIEIRSIDFALRDGHYYLSADIHYELTQTAREALQKGIPLYWDVLIKVVRERAWLWNKTLVDFKIRYRIQYHALLNNYRVTNISSSDSTSYASLSTALAGMSKIRNIAVLTEGDIAEDESYHVGVKTRFDREALPLPLRPAAYINPQWYLSSDWLQWPVQR